MIGNEVVKATDIQIASGYPLFFDTETIGLHGRICLAQFYQEGWEKVKLIQFDTPDELMDILPMLNETKLVIYNASYDISTLQRNLDYSFIPNDFEDAYYLARLHLYTQKEHNLEAVTNALIGNVYTVDGLTKKAFQKSNWSGILSEEQKDYAAKDVYYLAQVYEKVKYLLDDENYKLDMFSLREALEYQRNGLPIDTEACDAQKLKNQAEIKETGITVKINSYKEVAALMGVALGNPKYKGTDKLTLKKFALKPESMIPNFRTQYDPDVGHTFIDLTEEEQTERQQKIKSIQEVASKVLKVRTLSKQNSFLQKFVDTASNRRVFGIFAPSTKSGRFTCKEQNLQQLPRALREVFALPEDGHTCFIAADFAQLELRCVSVVAQERRMIKLFKEKGDPHSTFAIDLFGKTYTSEERRAAKTCNFTLLYGAGAESLADTLLVQSDLVVDLETASRYLAGWREAWPSIRAWQIEGSRLYAADSHKQTPMGRRYIGTTYMAHLNVEIQGFGAEVSKLALHFMLEDIKKNKLPASCVNFVHDEFVFEVAKDSVEEVGDIMIKSMKDAWRVVSKHTTIPDLPMPVEVAAGFNWGKLKNDNDTIWRKSVE